jgi:hypothetical protein
MMSGSRRGGIEGIHTQHFKEQTMTIEIEAQCVVPQRAEVVFEMGVDSDNLPKLFTGFAPLIPAIVQASVEGGGALREGSVRVVKLSDGSQIRERILRLEAPRLHAYDMLEMNTLQKMLCTNMVSEWRFTSDGGATRVVWRYTLHPKNLAMRPLVWLTGRLFERAMQRCLDNLARLCR